MTVDVEIAAIEWARARAAVVEASIYPIGNARYRTALNDLAAAESALAWAVELNQFNPATRRNEILGRICRRATDQIVTADQISEEFGISTRTVYRYMGILRARGVGLLSESGIGYIIKPRRGQRNGA